MLIRRVCVGVDLWVCVLVFRVLGLLLYEFASMWENFAAFAI